MNGKIDKFLWNVCNELKTSPGSVEIIKTVGTSALDNKNEADAWIQYGKSNIEEILLNVNRIIDIINNYKDYKENIDTLMCELFAILDDCVFHASIFNIYFFAIDNLQLEKQQFDFEEDLRLTEYLMEEEVTKKIIEIANQWNSKLTKEEKINFINNVYCNCYKIKVLFEKCFNDLTENISYRIDSLRKLHSFSLLLQYYWSVWNTKVW